MLPQIIKKLIERKQAQIRKVYPGLSCFKEGVRQIPVESVPGIREQGPWLKGQEGILRAWAGILRDVSPPPPTPFAGETGWKPLGKEKG